MEIWRFEKLIAFSEKKPPLDVFGKQQFSTKKGLTPLWYIAETAGLKILEEIEPGISKCTKGGAKFIFGNAFWHSA